MPISLGTVILPEDLRWIDEYAWSAITRSADYSLTGAVILQEAERLAGRPITLVSAADRAWISTATLASLDALNAIPGWEGTLTLADAREFTVGFRETGVTAEPVVFQAPGGAYSGWWMLTLLLQTV